jgi:hypothetical protein
MLLGDYHTILSVFKDDVFICITGHLERDHEENNELKHDVNHGRHIHLTLV